MELRQLLMNAYACNDGMTWACKFDSPAKAWDACENPEWLLWGLREAITAGLVDPTTHKTVHPENCRKLAKLLLKTPLGDDTTAESYLPARPDLETNLRHALQLLVSTKFGGVRTLLQNLGPVSTLLISIITYCEEDTTKYILGAVRETFGNPFDPENTSRKP